MRYNGRNKHRLWKLNRLKFKFYLYYLTYCVSLRKSLSISEIWFLPLIKYNKTYFTWLL